MPTNQDFHDKLKALLNTIDESFKPKHLGGGLNPYVEKLICTDEFAKTVDEVVLKEIESRRKSGIDDGGVKKLNELIRNQENGTE